MRRELIQQIYEYFVNSGSLPEEMERIFSSITGKVEELAGIEGAEAIGGELVGLGHEAFMAGANAMLDLISGKEVA